MAGGDCTDDPSEQEAGNSKDFFNGKFNLNHDPANGPFTSGPGGPAEAAGEGAAVAVGDKGESAGTLVDELGSGVSDAADSVSQDFSDITKRLTDILMPNGEIIGEEGERNSRDTEWLRPKFRHSLQNA